MKIVGQILEMPQAALIARELQRSLDEEQLLRGKFYEAISEQEKAEFINGEIIIHSPVQREHNEACLHLGQLLNVYVAKNDLGFVGIEKVMVSLSRNDYEPDICFFNNSLAKGFQKNQKLFPPPNFIVEILSPSTEKRDREVKFSDYEAHGVEEYWMVDVESKTIEQFVLGQEKYTVTGTFTLEDRITSQAVPGFQCKVKAVFDRNENLSVLQKFLEHSTE